MINAWQTIASREIIRSTNRCHCWLNHGGTKHNIIPDEVKMQLTVRTYKPETRERVCGNRSNCKGLCHGGWHSSGPCTDRQRSSKINHARDLQ